MVMYQGVNSNGEPWSSFRVEHERVSLDFDGEVSRTRQEFAADCDINTLMAQYERTGVVSHVNPREPMFVDLSTIPYDLQDALAIFASAEASFMSLPAQARASFDNDAMKFVEFAEKPENLPKLREWGLAPPEKVPDAPMRVEVVNPPAAPEAPPGA